MSKLSFQHTVNRKVINEIFHILFSYRLRNLCVFYTYRISQFSLATLQMLNSFRRLVATILGKSAVDNGEPLKVISRVECFGMQ